ncbi:MAG: hypothetical protein RSA49_00005, partial [Anaerovoracaceae bacterium]
MKETTNYGLKKPDGTDFVGPGPFNENADVIDKKLKSIEDEKADKNHNHDSTYYDKTNIDNKFKNENEKIEAISKIATENKEAITKKGNCNARFLQGET